MDSISYHLLAYYFLKHNNILINNNIDIKIEEQNNNIFYEKLTISKYQNSNLLSFSTNMYKWNNYKAFCLTITNSVGYNNHAKYYFHICPVTGNINTYNPTKNNKYPNMMTDNTNPTNPIIPSELTNFGQQILNLIKELSSKYNQDKIIFINNQLSNVP